VRIYNYKELRQELAAAGTRFRTATDTEVILAVYARWGIDGLKRLRGMFAFALWDDNAKGLLLARDGFGIKPLSYGRDGKELASEFRRCGDTWQQGYSGSGRTGRLLFARMSAR
jgi:asparagine synthetase B (glutamine-hydrolysing)